ncbi:hypothetical protein EJ05DRAFT_481289 [Pseudovirgaria hyperparasitica]|uniref:Uncharacterized protein n=1 Tax=Pseudovirgaria hyperparasitica TaxID=470096 RepID=A0A6A6VT42_9PEZI|nr:uncharacterized protein EJ05DRAFT_481289 [Pseudovirgaria hyperparasitica]KAF2752441.1 hypothetical protein EJ05DRAFT_481289 [Pseudovirgaria hyperparasitica]
MGAVEQNEAMGSQRMLVFIRTDRITELVLLQPLLATLCCQERLYKQGNRKECLCHQHSDYFQAPKALVIRTICQNDRDVRTIKQRTPIGERLTITPGLRGADRGGWRPENHPSRRSQRGNGRDLRLHEPILEIRQRDNPEVPQQSCRRAESTTRPKHPTQRVSYLRAVRISSTDNPNLQNNTDREAYGKWRIAKNPPQVSRSAK